MALQPLNGGAGSGVQFSEKIKASQMSAGQSIDAYLVRVEERDGDYGTSYNLVMQKATGEHIIVYTSGSLKYAAKDGKLATGVRTVITAKGKQKKTNKAGDNYSRTEFDVQQDPDDQLDSSSFNAVFNSAENVAPSTKAALAGGIKAKTEALSKVATGGRAK